MTLLIDNNNSKKIYTSSYLENTDIPAEISEGWGSNTSIGNNDVFLQDIEEILPYRDWAYNTHLAAKICANCDKKLSKCQPISTRPELPFFIPLSERNVA